MSRKTTLSLIKCSVGSLAGLHSVPKPLLNIAERNPGAKEDDLLNSYFVFNVGDDLQLLMVHEKGECAHAQTYG